MAQPPTMQSTPRDVAYIDTTQAYDQWANVYDTDGNFLQALDTIEMRSLLPDFWTQVKKEYLRRQQPSRRPSTITSESSTIVSEDGLGAVDAQIIGLDASNGMLDVARQKVQDFQRNTAIAVDVKLAPFDLLDQSSLDAGTLDLVNNTDGMISTLVAEHIPLDIYFASAAAILRPGACFLITNMHAEMGQISQAGFVDSATGSKVRPSRSYAHSVTHLLAEAAKAGFEVVSLPSTTNTGSKGDVEGVIERTVTQDMVEKLGKRSLKYVGVTVWLGVCLRKI
ncbi:hypothetical protein UA08_00817 [Talaromyces atroroseus]|uniref:Methyltransferase type 11 domain-containing protein n=1 Tax=Talaromyces atroroseus TaxID=1441469 RepID=A0A225AY05_TALAT|nr:hypothetical protein UA08_00817 [Talaromyces atroroseus]OKL64513.1 hypothetical protein UA08_00817 [Talaromyces atroroseus]